MADTAGTAGGADGCGTGDVADAGGSGAAGGNRVRSGWARRGAALAMGLSLVVGAAACGGGSSKKTVTTEKHQTRPATSDSSTSDSSTSQSSDGHSGSSFVEEANKICTDGNSQYGAELEKVGEQHKADTAEWAAGQSEALQGVEQHAAKALVNMSTVEEAVPDQQKSAFESFTLLVARLADTDGQLADAANGNDQQTFQQLDQQRSATSDQRDAAATKLGLDACAFKGLSDSDVSDIKELVTHSGTTNDPNLCTDAFTAAYVLEQFGTSDGCVKDQEHPSNPTPTSVTVTNVMGSGDYGTADATAHLPNGQDQKASFAVLRQDGKWRLMAFAAQ